MSRPKSVLLSVAALAIAAPAAAFAAPATTPPRVGVDKDKQVSFSMSGREVTITAREIDGQPNPIVRDLSETDVVLACRGTSPKKSKTYIADAKARWAKDATSQTLRLSKDVSVKPKWCVLERPQGTDLAVTFTMRIVKN